MIMAAIAFPNHDFHECLESQACRVDCRHRAESGVPETINNNPGRH
jgi:hypothetical protein